MQHNLLLILFSALLVNNIVLMRFLGLCPYLGVSRRLDTAGGMAAAVFFVMLLATWITWPIYHYVLQPWHLEFLRTAAFILVIASLVQFIEILLKRIAPALYTALGIYLPLITTNCAILGVTFIVINENYNFIEATVFAIGTALGFALALLLMAGIRERLELAPIPEVLKGPPIVFIMASLMSLAFLGFAGFMGLSL